MALKSLVLKSLVIKRQYVKALLVHADMEFTFSGGYAKSTKTVELLGLNVAMQRIGLNIRL